MKSLSFSFIVCRQKESTIA